MPRYLKGKSPYRKKNRIKIVIFIIFSAIIIMMTYGIANIDERIMPSVLAMANNKATNLINQAINNSMQVITKENGLTATDFYYKTTDNTGQVTSMSVNTVLVNDVCSKLAVGISQQLEGMELETVTMPIGGFFGIEAFANLGPSYSVTLMPVGNSIIEYESEFSSVGINQVNFQIWLLVESKVKIVNPIQGAEISVNRKIPLVNTIFSGQVPETYMDNVPVGSSIVR